MSKKQLSVQVIKIKLVYLLLAFFAALLATIVSTPSYAIDTYLIIDGPGAGTILFTETNFNIVTSDLNPNTQANGNIGMAEPNIEDSGCSGEHYHGTLNNSEDPAPRRCGWGKVIRFSNTGNNDILLKISASLKKENLAYNDTFAIRLSSPRDEVIELLSLTPSTLEEAMQSLKETRDLVNSTARSGAISISTARAINHKLRCAFSADREARRNIKVILDAFLNPPRELPLSSTLSSLGGQFILKLNRTSREIDLAFECKNAAIEIMQREGLL